MKYSLLLVAVMALALAGMAWAGTFVSDPTTTLPAEKTRARPMPTGTDPNTFIRAADFNALRGAILDLRDAVRAIPLSSAGVASVGLSAPTVTIVGSASACPTCVGGAGGTRGQVCLVQGGTGVKDTVSICAKDGADAYAWRSLY
jgi:hypothetical protein